MTGAAPPGEVSRRPRLALLAGVVLGLHVLVLRVSPGGADQPVPQSATAFITRTIESLPAAQAAPAPAPAPEAAPAPVEPPPPPPPPRPTPATIPPPPAPPPPPPPAPPAPTPVPVAPPVAAPATAPAPAVETAVEPGPSAESATAQAALSLPAGPPATTPFSSNPFVIGPTPPPPPTTAAAAQVDTAGGGGRGAVFGPGTGGTAPATPVAAPPPAIPGSVTLRYQVTAQTRGIDVKARAELVFRQDGKTYEARLETVLPLVPPRIQQSTGQITPEGLAPGRYAEKARNEEATHFERDKAQLSFSNNQPAAPLQAGAQDRLSVMLQLGSVIGGDPTRYPPSTTISVQTAGTRDAEVWLFTVEAEEELLLPGGRVRALKLTRTPRKPFDQTVELWLAAGMDYVPVRVRLTQANGDRLDQQWAGTDRP